MSDHDWTPAVVGLLTMMLARLLDWLLPRGHHSRWAARHSVRDDDTPHKSHHPDEGDDAE